MKKIMFLFVAALAATTWADRTANQGWVARNFAPSNLVGRIEALEHGGGGTETDPVFTNWRDTSTVIKIGADSGAEARAVAIGKYSTSGENSVSVGYCAAAEGYKSVAIGHDASATSDGAVQLGEGCNPEANTLQFKGYRLLNSNGKIPSERLPATPTLEEEDPYFTQWQQESEVALGGNAEAGGSGSVAVGSEAVASGTGSVAIGDGSLCALKGVAVGKMAACSSASCCAVGYDSVSCSTRASAFGAYAAAVASDAFLLGKGTNTVEGTLQFRDYQLLDARGMIPLARLGSALSGFLPVNPRSEYNDVYCIDKGIRLFEGASDPDGVAVFEGSRIRNRNFEVDTEEMRMGDGKEIVFDFLNKRLSFNDGSNWLIFPTSKNGTFALTSDVDTKISTKWNGAALAIGLESSASIMSATAVGMQATATAEGAAAFGGGAEATANYAVQLGMGKNTTANTLQFRTYQLLDANGKIPAERLTTAAVLTAIKAMDATQKAELKAALGIGQ